MLAWLMQMLCIVDDFVHINDDNYANGWSKHYHGTSILGISITLVFFACVCGPCRT